MTPITIFSVIIIIYLIIGLLQLFAFWLSWKDDITLPVVIVTLLLWPYLWFNVNIDWKNIGRNWKLFGKIFFALIAIYIIVMFVVLGYLL